MKYIFSVELLDFEESIKKILPNAELVKNNSDQFDTIITVKNRGYSTTIFKTLITVDNKKDNSYENYYIQAEYSYKDWNINISEPNEKPRDW